MGAGGYAPDPIGYPICTLGPHSCLQKYMAHGCTTRGDVKGKALVWVFCNPGDPSRVTVRDTVLEIVMPKVAEFC